MPHKTAAKSDETRAKVAATEKPSIPRKLEGGLLSKHRGTRPLCIIGVDEAGRGPLCGPVVAAACYVPSYIQIGGVQDSKLMTEKDREEVFEHLQDNASIVKAAAERSAVQIDESNILAATLDAMASAVYSVLAQISGNEMPSEYTEDDAACQLAVDVHVLVDGNRMPPRLAADPRLTVETIVKGDRNVFSIGAASVVAKVTRDRLMLEMDKIFPQFNLAKHKGYPTQDHQNLVAKHGPSSQHRLSFKPIVEWLRKGRFELPEGRQMPPEKERKPKAKAKAKAKSSKKPVGPKGHHPASEDAIEGHSSSDDMPPLKEEEFDSSSCPAQIAADLESLWVESSSSTHVYYNHKMYTSTASSYRNQMSEEELSPYELMGLIEVVDLVPRAAKKPSASARTTRANRRKAAEIENGKEIESVVSTGTESKIKRQKIGVIAA